MSVQRRRGQPVTLYRRKRVTDKRGNEQWAPDRENPIRTTAAVIPQRSSRAEVPGQAEVDVYRLIVGVDLDSIGLWSIVEWRGQEWDVVAPPAYRHGTRRVRHWSIDVRGRPGG